MSETTNTLSRSAPNQDAPPSAHGAFVWYELITPDPEAAKRFYERIIPGWAIDSTGETFANDIEYRMIRRSDGKEEGGVLRLAPAMSEHGARPAWLGYVAVNDIDSAIAKVVADGGTTTMPATDMEGVGRFAMVSDPWGAPLYLITPAPPPGERDTVSDSFDPAKAQRVRWNELWSSDPAGAIAFYSRHFGWVQNGDMDMGEMGKYQFIEREGVMIGAVMPRMPDVPASRWNFYFGVEDIDRAAEAVKAAGGQLFQDPVEIPGGEYALNGSDPQGALFGLVGPRK